MERRASLSRPELEAREGEWRRDGADTLATRDDLRPPNDRRARDQTAATVFAAVDRGDNPRGGKKCKRRRMFSRYLLSNRAGGIVRRTGTPRRAFARRDDFRTSSPDFLRRRTLAIMMATAATTTPGAAHRVAALSGKRAIARKPIGAARDPVRAREQVGRDVALPGGDARRGRARCGAYLGDPGV